MPFGGVCVLLFGEPYQIPQVLGYSLRDPKSLPHANAQGKYLGGLFELVFRIDYNY